MNALLRGIAIFFPANLLTIGRVTSPFSVLFLWSTGSTTARLYVRVRRFAGVTTYGKFRIICCRILQRLQEID